MKNLNQLYNSLKLNVLSRKDIETYKVTSDSVEKKSIEQKALAHPFEQDALEGWNDSNASLADMKSLDNRFVKSNSFFSPKMLGVSAGIIVVAICAIIYVNQLESNNLNELIIDQPTLNANQQDLIIEETDLILPAPIEQMKNAPLKNQQQPQLMKEEFAQMNTENIPEIQVENINVLPVKPIEKENMSIVKNRTNGKEIYLNDLKLIDYRIYRSKPAVKTKQVLLTGTPANKEEKTGDDVEATWKVVDIPYIDYLEKSLRIFNQENYKKALSRFETILISYPEDINANFYGGLCLYNLGEYKTAIEHFEICLNGKFHNFDEESLWMIAQSYDFLGQKSAAKKTYTAIIESNGFYATQAKVKLKE